MMPNKEVTSKDWWSSKLIWINNNVVSYCFFIHIILIISIAIIQIRFSTVYTDHCPIDDRIILYMLIMGIIQIIYSLNGILLIIFSLLHNKYRFVYRLVFICFGIHQIIIILLIVCFIIGNYLVFHIKNVVQYINSYNTTTYCHYSLYQTAYWTIIIQYILMCLFSMICVFKSIKWFSKKFRSVKINSPRDSNDDIATNQS